MEILSKAIFVPAIFLRKTAVCLVSFLRQGAYVKYGIISLKFKVYLGSSLAIPPSPPAFGLIYEGAIGQPR
jgi:hypothetical protein